jgi:hypothetical protein
MQTGGSGRTAGHDIISFMVWVRFSNHNSEHLHYDPDLAIILVSEDRRMQLEEKMLY